MSAAQAEAWRKRLAHLTEKSNQTHVVRMPYVNRRTLDRTRLSRLRVRSCVANGSVVLVAID